MSLTDGITSPTDDGFKASGSRLSSSPRSPSISAEMGSLRRKLEREMIESDDSIRLWTAALRMVSYSRIVLATPKALEITRSMSLPTNKLGSFATLESKVRMMSVDDRNLMPKTPQNAPKRSRGEELSPCHRQPGQDMTNERAIVSLPNGESSKKSVMAAEDILFLEKHRQKPPLSLTQIWGTIIRHVADPQFALDEEQARRTLQYGSDGYTLAEEMDLRAKGKSHQIWRLLESTGCLSYTI
jgi:hypothetical protein